MISTPSRAARATAETTLTGTESTSEHEHDTTSTTSARYSASLAEISKASGPTTSISAATTIISGV